MTSPDLGGGKRRRRRPGSFFTVFILLFLLFSSSHTPSTPDQIVSGDSDAFGWDRHIAPFLLRSADLEFQCLHCSCFLWVAIYPASVRLCSYFQKYEKSRSLFNLISTPLTGCSKSLYPFNPAGVSSLIRFPARQDRYKIPTPIVWNINSKFPMDFGVLHGTFSVMGKTYRLSGIYSRRVSLSCCCILPILNRHCFRLCTASRIDCYSRSCLPAFAWTFDCSLAELSTGTVIGLSLTGIDIYSTPDCSTTALNCRQSIDQKFPYAAAETRGNLGHLPTLIWEKGVGLILEVESPFAVVNAFTVLRLRPCEDTIFSIGLCVGYFVMSKNWIMDPIKPSV